MNNLFFISFNGRPTGTYHNKSVFRDITLPQDVIWELLHIFYVLESYIDIDINIIRHFQLKKSRVSISNFVATPLDANVEGGPPAC
jgi:hypothetical protein